MMVAPITSTALKSAPERYAGIASGVNSTVSRLGSLVAVALIGLIISLVFEGRTDVADAVPLAKDQEPPELRDASIAAFRAGMVARGRARLRRRRRRRGRHLQPGGAARGAGPRVSEQAAAPAET